MTASHKSFPRRAGTGYGLQAFAATLFIGVSLARGQVFQLDGGSSSLFQASGGSVIVHGTDYDGSLGAGFLAGQLTVGASLRARWHHSIITLGDSAIPFRLATDVLDQSHYVWGRGVGIAMERESVRLFGFAGATAMGLGSPFFSGARPEKAVGPLLH